MEVYTKTLTTYGENNEHFFTKPKWSTKVKPTYSTTLE